MIERPTWEMGVTVPTFAAASLVLRAARDPSTRRETEEPWPSNISTFPCMSPRWEHSQSRCCVRRLWRWIQVDVAGIKPERLSGRIHKGLR
jgi:hypothetical protein